MRVKLVAIGALTCLINSHVWAEAFVEDLNASPASAATSRFNETSSQEFVQRNEGAAQNSKAPAVLLSKIETLQQEIQELRGKLEVQSHDLKLLNDQQQAFYKDIDTRLSKVVGNSHEVKIPTEHETSITDVKTEVKSNSEHKPAAKVVSKAPTLAIGNQGDGEQSYNAAYQLIKGKQYTEAISALEAFLIAYPGSGYQANANYWLGELYLMQGHTDQALQAFSRVVKQYPKSSKAVAAQLKIGISFYDKGQWQPAREALQKVVKSYPDTSYARLATEHLQAMDQQGL